MKERFRSILRIIWKPLLGLTGLAILIIWTTGAFTERVEPGVVKHTPGFALPEDAETVTVELRSLPRRVGAVGTVVSDNTVQLNARISAHVTDVLVSAGEEVSRAQVLVRLDDRDVRAQRDAARAGLRRAETEYERIKKLHTAQAATEQQLIAAESAFHSAASQVEQAEALLTHTKIRAPMDGLVTDRHVETGTLAHPGQTLLSVYDPSLMRLDAAVPVRLVDYLTIDDIVEVELERPAAHMQGRVHRVVGEIDARSRTQTVQIMLESNDTPVLPGTFGRVWIPATERDAYVVPETAIYRVGQLEMVQVVEDGRVIRRLVKAGEVRDGAVEVLSGLQEGEEVLVQPVK